MIQERNGLDKKVTHLEDYLMYCEPSIDLKMAAMLDRQLSYMKGYLSILNHRISEFENEELIRDDTTRV